MRIVLFTRVPVAGQVKTRLIPALGAAGAARLQHEMTMHALAWCLACARDLPAELEVRYTGGTEQDMRGACGGGFRCVPQGEGDLGARMLRACEAAARAGVMRMILIGSDCPAIDADRLRAAADSLEQRDLVLGPARDGGYYLIGMRVPQPELFEDMNWGESSVFTETLRRARAQNLQVAVLDVLSDIDEPADLTVWREQRRRRPVLAHDAPISVIVPALNEADRVGLLIEHLCSTRARAEIIVADGGSRDGTAQRARAGGARVVTGKPGRARQMNAGAAEACGDILVFLHADTLLPASWEHDVRRSLREPSAVAGAFRFALDGQERRFRLLEQLVNWRARRLKLPYGDQALFVRADVFRGLGGFPDLAVMEDFELVKALKRRGRLVSTGTQALTSARQWRTAGFVRATAVNQLTILGHLAGVPSERLARWRRRLLMPRGLQ